MNKPAAHLSALGFTDYESKAYVALLSKGPMTGYQVAKVSAVPRANIYSVLERLQERGAVTRTARGDAVEYQALPAEEMLNRFSHSLQSDITRARTSLNEIKLHDDHPLAWNIKGYDAFIAKAERMLKAARHHVLIALWPQEAGRLARPLEGTLKQGLKPTVLCMHGCEHDCGGCAGRIYRYPIADAAVARRSLVLTTDDNETLIGQIEADGTCLGAHSSTEVLAVMTAQYILNAIAVAEIVRSLGPKMLTIVDKEAMTALKTAGLAVEQETWFDRIWGTFSKEKEKERRKS